MEYLDFLQVSHDYAYMTVCMHASTIWSILQPTEQTRASTTPLVKQLLKGVFRKNQPTRVWAETWEVKKVLDLLHAWRNLSVLNYTHLSLKTVMIETLTTVMRPSDQNLLWITPKAMLIPSEANKIIHSQNQSQRGLKWEALCPPERMGLAVAVSNGTIES